MKIEATGASVCERQPEMSQAACRSTFAFPNMHIPSHYRVRRKKEKKSPGPEHANKGRQSPISTRAAQAAAARRCRVAGKAFAAAGDARSLKDANLLQAAALLAVCSSGSRESFDFPSVAHEGSGRPGACPVGAPFTRSCTRPPWRRARCPRWARQPAPQGSGEVPPPRASLCSSSPPCTSPPRSSRRALRGRWTAPRDREREKYPNEPTAHIPAGSLRPIWRGANPPCALLPSVAPRLPPGLRARPPSPPSALRSAAFFLFPARKKRQP